MVATEARLVPLDDLGRQHGIAHELTEAIAQVPTGGSSSLGPAVDEFETAFAKYCGVTAAVGAATRG